MPPNNNQNPNPNLNSAVNQPSSPPPPGSTPVQSPAPKIDAIQAAPNPTGSSSGSKKWMIFVVLALILIVIVGGVYYYLTSQTSTGKKAGTDYVRTVDAADLQQDLESIELGDVDSDFTAVDQDLDSL